MIISPKGVVLIKRATGQPVGPVIALKSSENFYRLPRLDQRVWRYMEYWKFESLIKDGALYFRRSDKLEDDMEGKYADANRNYTTGLWGRFSSAYRVNHDPKAFEQGALDFRYAVFVNCWHINRVESREMWERFGKSERSVVIVTTVRRLLKAVEANHVQPGKVIYASQAVPRPEWSHNAPFFFKNLQFMSEKEFRLIAHKPEEEPIYIDQTFGHSISVKGSEIIEMVKLHPEASPCFKEEIKTFLRNQNVKLAVSRSSLCR